LDDLEIIEIIFRLDAERITYQEAAAR